MKLKSYVSVALLATLPLSAVAEETKTPEVGTDAPGAVAEVATEKATEEKVADQAPVTQESVAEEVFSTSPWYSGIEFGVGASATSGLNGFVGYANKKSDYWLLRRLGVRLDFASTRPIKSPIDSLTDSIIGDEGIEIKEITIKDFDIDAKHIGAIVDFYPFGDTWFLGGWRISGGYFMGDLSVGADLTGNIEDLPAGGFSFEYDGVEYKYVGNMARGTAAVDWDFSGPYVGTGFDFGLFAGFKIFVDAGLVFPGEGAKISAEIPQDNLFKRESGGIWESASLEEVNAAKDKALADVQQELDKIDFYPMVKVGFMYRF